MSMSNTGKTAFAMAALAVVIGFGWWALDRKQHIVDPDIAATDSSTGATSGSATAIVATGLLPDPDWLAEMHASVQLLTETLATTGNVGGAVALIDVLDARVARQPASAKLSGLRVALAADRQRLVSAKALDIASAAASIEKLVASVDVMPLISAPEPFVSKASASTSLADVSPGMSLDTVMAAIRARLSDVVRIRKVEHPEAVFLTPEQGALVAERLRLRLLSARLALIGRQEQMFTQDISMADNILSKAFDPQDANVIESKKTLASLKALSGRLAVPVQLQSVAAIEQLRSELLNRQP